MRTAAMIASDAAICNKVLSFPQMLSAGNRGCLSKTGRLPPATRIMTSRPTTSQTSHQGASPAIPKQRYKSGQQEFVGDRIEVGPEPGDLTHLTRKITVSSIRKSGDQAQPERLNAVVRPSAQAR